MQREYARRNPHEFRGYDEDCWGISANDGPGPRSIVVDRVERRFFGYVARGVPFGPDDGTLAPNAMLGSLPFAPQLVVAALRALCARYPQLIARRPAPGRLSIQRCRAVDPKDGCPKASTGSTRDLSWL